MKNDGWVLVSNNEEGTLQLTNIVHHIDGCGMNNGRNVLGKISPEEARWKKHCLRCEAKLGNRSPVARPTEGKKVEVRLNDQLLAGVDAHASSMGLTRADALREIITAGLPMSAGKLPGD